MKPLKAIEQPRMNLNPNHRLSPEEMSNVQGGAGCICNKNSFRLNGDCVCDKNKFGLCSGVRGRHEQIYNLSYERVAEE